jgi:predicted Zn finger-like uncharacterized protein/prepilin-type processing-associated H-X9-DG protein
MAQQIRCPHCGQTYELTPEQVPQYAGQTINCTSCKQAFTVPRDIVGGVGGGAGAYAPPGAPPQQPAYQQQQQQPYGQHQPQQQQPPYPGQPAMAPQYPGGPVGYGGYQPPPQQESNGLAVASLIFGIIGLFIPVIPSIVGVILGILGLKKTKDPRVGGKGLAIAGIAVSCASFLMLGCMMSILLPSLNRARETANRVKCASNLRQIGQALLLYSNENRGRYPADFQRLLTTQDITSEAFCCPSTNATPAAPGGTPQQQAAALHQHCTYIYIPGLNNAASAQTVVAYEPLDNHDGDGANFLFGDGHVSWETKQTAAAMIKNLEGGQNPPKTR